MRTLSMGAMQERGLIAKLLAKDEVLWGSSDRLALLCSYEAKSDDPEIVRLCAMSAFQRRGCAFDDAELDESFGAG